MEEPAGHSQHRAGAAWSSNAAGVLHVCFVGAQVLSVVAQQLLTIQNALRANLDKFWFEGRPIRLQQTCGVFSECVERG